MAQRARLVKGSCQMVVSGIARQPWFDVFLYPSCSKTENDRAGDFLLDIARGMV